MRFVLVLLALIGLTLAGGAAPSIESGVAAEVNLLRTQPRAYAQFLRELKPFYQGTLLVRPGHLTINTKEGSTALDEAVLFLEQQAPVGPLKYSVGMSMGCLDHVKDQARTGQLGHKGADQTMASERVARYGIGRGVGENIMYGSDQPRDIVMQLVIDDNVADRGHRINFFRPDYEMVGVACGPHPTLRNNCVIALAVYFQDDQAGRSAPASFASVSQPPAVRGNGSRVPSTPLQEARTAAESHIRAILEQDRATWVATFTPTQRAYAGSLWKKALDAAAGATFVYGCTEKTSSTLKKFRYLRNVGGKITPCFITVILESGRWMVDEVSY